MKRANLTRPLSVLFSAALLLSLTVLPAGANSAQTRWEGVSSTGAIVADAACPVVVEHELLTFDVAQLPQSYYREQEDFLAYSASVSARYTFYNPADYTVTARLLFPFGAEPKYASTLHRADDGKFGVSIDGTAVESVLRHTYFPTSRQFELETDLALLHDGLVEHQFYTPDTPVTRYTYTVSGVDNEAYPAAGAAFDWTDNGQTKLMFPSMSGFHRQDSGAARVSCTGKNGSQITLYAAGAPVQVDWAFYSNGSLEEPVDGTMTLTSTETMTLRDLALDGWSADSGVSEADWYNAAVARLDRLEAALSPGLLESTPSGDGLSSHLMRWYEYEIILTPGQRVTNTVTAPLYPAIHKGYEPPIYTYTYLLSPAQTWAQFGALDIVVNTPYYLTECALGEFTEAGTGYTLSLDGLPDGELEFTLSAGENPKPVRNYAYLSFLLIPIVLALLVLAALVVAIVRKVRKRRPKQP